MSEQQKITADEDDFGLTRTQESRMRQSVLALANGHGKDDHNEDR